MAGGRRLTAFDTNPNLGAQLLEALQGGVRVRQEREQTELRKKRLDEEANIKEIQTVLSLLGPEEAVKKAVEFGLVPKGSQTPFQKATAGLPPEERATAERRRATGTGLRPDEQTQAERIGAGLQLRPVDRLNVGLGLLDRFGTATDDLRKQFAEAGLTLPSGQTLGARATKAQEAQATAAKQSFRLQLLSSLTGRFSPAIDVQTGDRLATDEQFNDAMDAFTNFVVDGTPVPRGKLARLQSTDVQLEALKQAAAIPPDLEARFETLKTLSSLVAAQKGKMSRETRATIEQLTLDIITHSFFKRANPDPDPDAEGGLAERVASALSRKVNSILEQFFGPGLASVPSPEVRKAIDQSIRGNLPIESLAPQFRPRMGQRLGALSSPQAVERIPDATRVNIEEALRQIAAAGGDPQLVADAEAGLVRIALEGGDINAEIQAVMEAIAEAIGG